MNEGTGKVLVPGSRQSDSEQENVFRKITDFADHVTDAGTARSSYFDLITTAVSPASGAATYAIATDSRKLSWNSLTSTAAEICYIGIGTSIEDAEANRDAAQIIVKAGEIGDTRFSDNAKHYSIKSVSGTPQVHLAQEA